MLRWCSSICRLTEQLSRQNTAQEIASLSQVNHHLHQLTKESLFRFDAREGRSSALPWAATRGRVQTAEKALKALQTDGQLHPASISDSDSSVQSVTDRVDIALVHAAEKGHAGVVKLLLKHGTSLLSAGTRRRQIVTEAACLNGQIEVVELLLESGADLSVGHYMRLYAVQCAAMMGHADIVQLVIDTSASPDTCSGRPEGGSYLLLQLAIRGTYEETAKLLIIKGAKTNLWVGRMHTALEEAVMGNHLWAVKLVFAQGAMVFAPASGLVRCSALEMAKGGRKDMYELLKDRTVWIWPINSSDGDTATKRAYVPNPSGNCSARSRR